MTAVSDIGSRGSHPDLQQTRETVVLDANAHIEYVYLTFETELLEPIIPRNYHTGSYPQCPDLVVYGSPLLWSPARKWLLLTLACTATFLTS